MNMENLFTQETKDKGVEDDEMYPQAAVIDKNELSCDNVHNDPPQKKMRFTKKAVTADVISEDPRYHGIKVSLKEIEDQTSKVILNLIILIGSSVPNFLKTWF